MILTNKYLSRRTCLRGLGVSVALPFLDAMVPASSFARTAAKPTPRLAFVYVPNGTIHEMWIPKGTGREFEWSPILSPLARVREHAVVFSGLAHVAAEGRGDGNGGHARGTAVWLSGVHAYDRNIGGVAGVRLATTADQIAASHLGTETRLRSLEVSLEKASQIACDSEDCFFSNTTSWRSPTTPLPMETHPRVVFERLFGEGRTAAERLADIRSAKSILDSVQEEAAKLGRTLGTTDRAKLTEYLDAVREVEQRITGTEKRASESETALPDRPIDIPERFYEYVTLMFDLQVLAFQGDITRVISTQMGREASSRTYDEIGVPEQHHNVSHHINNPAIMARKAKIDQYHVLLLTDFLEKLKAIPDGDGSLLDHALVLCGSGLGDGNTHGHRGLPTILAGGAGQLKGGRHLAYPEATPMANLLVSLLHMTGVPAEAIGDSTGPLAGL